MKKINLFSFLILSIPNTQPTMSATKNYII